MAKETSKDVFENLVSEYGCKANERYTKQSHKFENLVSE